MRHTILGEKSYLVMLPRLMKFSKTDRQVHRRVRSLRALGDLGLVSAALIGRLLEEEPEFGKQTSIMPNYRVKHRQTQGTLIAYMFYDRSGSKS